MKKWFSVLLCVGLLLTLTACGGGENRTTAAPQSSDASSQTEEADVLGFLKDGEVYFDVNLKEESVSGLSITVDGTAWSAGQKLPYKQGSQFEVKGSGAEGRKIYVYLITETKEGDNYRANQICSVTDANAFEEVMARHLKKLGGSKACVIIIDTKDGWDHKLSERMNRFIEMSIIPFV